MRVGTFLTEMTTKTFFDTLRAPFRLHFGGIFVTLGSLFVPSGALGEVLEGSKNEVEKRDPPKECKTLRREEGGSLIVIELGD